ncbi:MAG: hypothetical protein ABI946_03215 [Chthoniobacterales bacterium]
MRPRRSIITGIACALALALTACGQRSEKTSPEPPDTKATTIDSCRFLTAAEIQAVQNSPITNSEGSSQPDPAFSVSQCVYTAADHNRSVSLTVTRKNQTLSSAREVKDLWRETFGEQKHAGESDAEKKESAGEEEGEKRAAPTKVTGVGEAAYWVGYQFGGALYVLHHDALIRLSLGGPDSKETKLEKSKTLAQKIISRL